MTDYTKLTDFASKDALPTGNAAKIVKGTEIDDEFEAIETAIATKSDLNSPTFTGTPAAPTASAATDSTQLATTAFVKDVVTSGGYVTTAGIAADAVTGAKIADDSIDSEHYVDGSIDTAHLANDAVTGAKIADNVALAGNPTTTTQSASNDSTRIATTAFVRNVMELLHPVGSVYISTVSTNPNTLFGFGTWTAFGSGKVLVGQDTNDSDFNVLEETGGSKTHNHGGSTGGHSLTESQMPRHYHEYVAPNSITSPQGGTASYGIYGGGTPDDGAIRTGTWSAGAGAESGGTETGTSNGASHSHDISSADNMQPYIVVKMWKRTA